VRYSFAAQDILCETYSLDVAGVTIVSDKITRLFINPFLFTGERIATSIFPVTGAEIFELSTFSHDAGTRNAYPVPVYFINPELSTESGEEVPPIHKQLVNKKEMRKRVKHRDKKYIFI
jgi:hypothetical protein